MRLLQNFMQNACFCPRAIKEVWQPEGARPAAEEVLATWFARLLVGTRLGPLLALFGESPSGFDRVQCMRRNTASVPRPPIFISAPLYVHVRDFFENAVTMSSDNVDA